MTRHYPTRRHAGSPRKRPRQRGETTFEAATRYGVLAATFGLGVAFAAEAWEQGQARQAILEALPSGFVYSGCDEVRAAGVAPLYSYEAGFSDRLDGDGDGIGCERYRSE